MGPVEPTTTGNIDGSASNGTMDGKQGEGSTKITTACITISRSPPKRKLSIAQPKSQYDTGIEVNFSAKQAYFSTPPAAAVQSLQQASNQSDSSMQSDEAGQGDVHVSSERPMNGQRALHGKASDHQSGAGEAVSTPSRLDDSLIGSYTAPQQQFSSEPNGKHSWEAELSFEMSSDSHGSAAEPAAVAGQHQGCPSRQSGSNHLEPQFEGGEIENEPRVRQDVARESDRRDDEELPEQGLAQSLLSRFKDIESEAQQVKQTEHRPSGVAVKATPTPLRPATRQVPEDAIDGGGGASDFHRPQEKAEVENEPVVRTDVVKESDTNVAEELPERGMARNLLSKFKTMEVEAQQRSEYKPSGVSARAGTDVQLIWKGTSGQSPSPSLSSSAGPHREPAFEGGDLENTPHVRTDVVRESDGSVEEELPERGLAQSLLSRFKTLESEATKKQEYRPSGVAHKATPSKMHIMAGRSVYVPDGTTKGSPGGGADAGASSAVHEPQFEGGEFENTPEVRADVIKESDRALEEDLPQQGLAKNLLTRFKSIEAEASVQKDYVPSGVGSKPTPTPLSLANTAVGRRAVLSAHESSADSRGSSSERDFASAAYSDSAAAANGGEYENEPAPRPEGVISSTDRNDADELPENGLAQSVLSKFKSLEAQKASDYQPSGVGSKATPTPLTIRK